jgi:hypothetical protein
VSTYQDAKQVPHEEKQIGGPPNWCPDTDRDRTTSRKVTDTMYNTFLEKKSSIDSWNVRR